MIPVQAAVGKALAFYESLPSKGKPSEILVEEVEYSEKEDCYFVTLGYNVLDTAPAGKNPLSSILSGTAQYRREYKIFKVNAGNGAVVYMKIRKI